MKKEIQVLYTIFELELAPPFKFIEDPDDVDEPYIYNKRSEEIGIYNIKRALVYLDYDKTESILRKIKKTFVTDKLSNDDVYLIAKHLLNWLQDNFPKKVSYSKIWNFDEREAVSYPNKNNSKS